jgi:O-antigen/teichoic acid export membrane protein
MKRSTSRNLYLIGLLIVVIGLIPFFLAYLGVDQNLGDIVFLFAGVVLLLVGGLLMFIGYLGALAQMTKLSQWAWFVLLLLSGAAFALSLVLLALSQYVWSVLLSLVSVSLITMFIYIFAGPTESKAALPLP